MLGAKKDFVVCVIILILVFVNVPLLAVDWTFRETIIDDNPPQPSRVTDCAIVDINGDGKPDLWFSARKGSHKDEDHFMPWYENTGDMTNWKRHLAFQGPACYGAWGDMDGDGDMDLIADKDRKRELLWMENPLPAGDPAEDTWKIWPIEQEGTGFLDPDEVYTSWRGKDNQIHHGLDLNDDGHLDILNFKYGSDIQYIPGLKNPCTPNGKWPYCTIGSAGGTGSLGDLDRDGDIDVAVRNGWYENPGDPLEAPWPRHSFQAKGASGKVEIGDIDGDGKLDVVVSSEEETDGITWFRNPGRDAKGAWAATNVIAPSSGWKGLHSLQLADFDGDSDLDVFTAQMHGRQEQRVAICENVDGKGNSWIAHVLSKCGTHNAKVADLNADGAPDIAGKNYEDDNRPRIWINPNGPFNQAKKRMSLDNWRRHVVSEDGAPDKGYHIFAVDLNGDSQVDIATGDAWYENPGHPGDNWMRHGLEGSLGRIIAVFDFDRDGSPDILGGGFGWARNDGEGAFKVFGNIPAEGGFVQGAAVGCFSSGRRDISVIYTYKNGDHVRRLDVPSNPASAEWADHLVYDWAGKSKDIDVGDIDRDGDLDVMFVGRDSDTLQWLPNNGDRSFTAHTFAKAPSPIVHRCKLADIDGDGKLDVLTGSKGRKLHWYKQPGNATSTWKETQIAGPGKLNYDPLSIDAADMDRDGDLDVVAGEHSPPKPQDCRLLIFENTDGAGAAWSAHLVYKSDEHHQGAQAVDIDRDGDHLRRLDA
ncbi:MAG: FG-GAP repeat domain-containing protein [Planctomycetota bacterium]|jgi:hypothetical protein